MRGRQIRYSRAELSFVEENKAMTRRDLHAAFVAEFGRQDVRLCDLKALCSRRKWNTGRTGCFEKGLVPFNKGKPHPARGRAVETQFKKGQRSGAVAIRYKPIGAERLTKNGYLQRKVSDDAQPANRRWRLVHVIRWEAANGPLPRGMALKCLNGNRRDTDPGNWKPIPRAMLPRLDGRHGRDFEHAPAELRPTILAVTELELKARQVSREVPSHG